MKAFAYISILEAVLKLAILYLLLVSPFDKLSTYTVLLTLVALLIRIIYGIYCKCSFEECDYKFVYDKTVVKAMSAFASWNLFGNGAYLLNTQGVNILINLYFGVTTNAARGIATQVETAVSSFVGNFTTAMNPQITKSYATGNLKYMFQLVCYGAKYSYFLLLIFVVPLVLEADHVLELWLEVVPDGTSLFLRLTLFGTLVTSLGNSGLTAMMATGDIKRYQIWITTVGCLVFPLTWMAYKIGASAYMTYIIFVGIYTILLFVRLYIMRGALNFPIMHFIKQVLLRSMFVSIPSFTVPGIFICYTDYSLVSLFAICAISFLSTITSIYLLGLDRNEKRIVYEKIVSRIPKI
jgi:O-antigen/teichoic acid export membrane protein